MKTTALFSISAIIAAIGSVASAYLAIMATPAHACPPGTGCPPHEHDKDDIGHGQSFHDINGDLHSNGKA